MYVIVVFSLQSTPGFRPGDYEGNACRGTAFNMRSISANMTSILRPVSPVSAGSVVMPPSIRFRLRAGLARISVRFLQTWKGVYGVGRALQSDLCPACRYGEKPGFCFDEAKTGIAWDVGCGEGADLGRPSISTNLRGLVLWDAVRPRWRCPYEEMLDKLEQSCEEFHHKQPHE